MRLLGVRDAWTKSFGSTVPMTSTSMAILNALRELTKRVE